MANTIEIKTYQDYKAATNNDTVNDELNPCYLYNQTANKLLVDIINGDVDAVLLAKAALANRGMGPDGKWVGFDKSAELLGLK